MKDCNFYLRLIKTLVDGGVEESKALELVHTSYPEISFKVLKIIYHNENIID